MRLWDAASNSVVAIMNSGSTMVLMRQQMAVAFSPDGLTVASGGLDGRVLLWRCIETGRLVKRRRWSLADSLDLSFGPLRALTFAPEGQVVASGYEFAQLNLWDSFSGAPTLIRRPLAMKMGSKGIGQRIQGLAWGSGGIAIATGGPQVVLLDPYRTPLQ